MLQRNIRRQVLNKRRKIMRLEGENFEITQKCSDELSAKREKFGEKRKELTKLCCEYLQLHCQSTGLQPIDVINTRVNDIRRELKNIESHIKSYQFSGYIWRVMLLSYYNKATNFLRRRSNNKDVTYLIYLFELRNRRNAYWYLLRAKEQPFRQRIINNLGPLLFYSIFSFLTLSRLALVIFAIIMVFSCIYGCEKLGIAIYNNNCSNPINSFWDAIYFSVITFTTLGFGDIVAGSHGLARMVIVAEVSLGYLVLGIFISLIVKKLDL